LAKLCADVAYEPLLNLALEHLQVSFERRFQNIYFGKLNKPCSASAFILAFLVVQAASGTTLSTHAEYQSLASQKSGSELALSKAVNDHRSNICLLLERSGCSVIAGAAGFFIEGSGHEMRITYARPILTEQSSPDENSGYFEASENPRVIDGLSLSSFLKVSDDIMTLIVAGELSQENANLILTELSGLSDVFYRLPRGQDELKQALGFPSEAHFSSEEHVEMLDVHIQIALGINVNTARYLARVLGLQAIQIDQVDGSF
jgi:hypothetical protein